MLLQLLLAVIQRSQIGEKVQQNLMAKSSSSVAGSIISGKFSDIQFHIFIAKSCFVLPIARSQLLLVGHLQNIFQIWGWAIGGVQLSSAEESNPQKDQTGQFAFREQVILSLLIFSFWSYHQKSKQKIFFYKAETFTNGNEKKSFKVLFSLG